LAQLARVIKPDGTRWPLRFWDPRVFWHLPRVLPSGQHQALVAQWGRWCWFDPTNQFVTTGERNPADNETAPIPLALSKENWSSLARVGSVNRVLALARDWGVHPTESNARRIDALVQRCHALGFLSEQDELVFCTCGLTCRDDFDRHPSVSRALLHGAQQGASAMQVLQSFGDDFWTALRLQPTLTTT
jgi:hypothetical protein